MADEEAERDARRVERIERLEELERAESAEARAEIEDAAPTRLAAGEGSGETPRGDAAGRPPAPTVVVDDLHVVYRVHTAGTGRGNAATALARLVLRRGSPNVHVVHAVRGVSFVAYRGEAVGIIGSNGSGKSTLLKAIAGLLPAERGRVYTEGQPSLLGVNAALMNDLTGGANVVLGGLAMGMGQEEVQARYQQIVDFSGINDKGDFISLPMRTYSSGMSARLRFSIAAAKNHDVLMIDEALATGDRAFQKRSEERIRELREEAGTVFLVSHNNKSIRDTCDRALWIEKGELLMDGPADEVVDAYERG
ncbi:putative ABC transporter ATP-binding protein [Actinacidiphila reveromycinica]|uniref:Putative ABC transporter ATP-binding protein n=1 Tax=Actinacidiphila reveromycinica TaxID=659352 RepID=A0A7U3UP28_9ACTN|nr:putative ABC transporter ATP-binding protein [Streptomyces sp. SN-593]